MDICAPIPPRTAKLSGILILSKSLPQSMECQGKVGPWMARDPQSPVECSISALATACGVACREISCWRFRWMGNSSQHCHDCQKCQNCHNLKKATTTTRTLPNFGISGNYGNLLSARVISYI